MGQKKFRLLLAVLLLATLGFLVLRSPAPQIGHRSTDITVPQAAAPLPVSYDRQVKPLLERRCVVCHSCYDAPCQLKLSSPEGIQRGATRERVYNSKRLVEAQPTRLFVDERSVEGWRSRGFHPVLNEGVQSPERNLADSLLYRLLQLKQQHPLPENRKLPDGFTLELNREQQCVAVDAFEDFAREHPLWGMPYAMPALEAGETRVLESWLAQGAPLPAPPAPSAHAVPQLERWETFLNAASNKQRLVSRYLYEHLFHAHLHFAQTPEREFYRLVRSTTPAGQAVDEIPTQRPFDDPGPAPFYYRLLRYHPGIVTKNHIVYELSDQRMARFRTLFLQPDYAVPELPSYQPALAANPFRTFSAIPPDSRYRFLLDDARFFIEGFVKGPVCRGQIALSAIEDQFWVLFFNPDRNIFTAQPEFLETTANYMQLPVEDQGPADLVRIWSDYWQRQKHYMSIKQSYFEKREPAAIGQAIDYIWDGDGNNPNAALTVFRHFDSGSVAYGLVGGYPETTWVIDYPLFERIHYLLVAGFNVYGNVFHQLTTRLYMDFLRMEGEDQFLVFLPVEKRRALHDAWYKGIRSDMKRYLDAPTAWLQVESVTGFSSPDPQRELYHYIERRLDGAAVRGKVLNRCGNGRCRQLEEDMANVAGAMSRLEQMHGTALHAFPDVAFVQVLVDAPGRGQAFSLVRNKAYRSVTFLFEDERQRDRDDVRNDSLSVLHWLEGSYPNFFFRVKLSEVGDFARQCAAIRTEDDYEAFVERYGVRRTSPLFWQTADWFHDQSAREKPVRSGLFDLSRYRDL